MLKVKVEGGSTLRFLDQRSNTGLGVVFQRTLRIPDDGKKYPLPPGLGSFPVRRVLDYKDRVPPAWLKSSGVFIPMYQREAMWISFQSRHWRPNAVKVAAGKINAVSGRPWSQALEAPSQPERGGLRAMFGAGSSEPEQDYLTVPPQPWLDGFNSGKGVIRQFVAMPLGMGYTVEGQVTGKEEHGGIQLIVYEPKPGRFPEQPPPPPPPMAAMAPGGFGGPYSSAAMPPPSMAMPMAMPSPAPAKAQSMGLGAGGKMEQKIYPDPHGLDTWNPDDYGRVFVHIVNSVMWREITGEAVPPSPVDARAYSNAGYPWFKVYDDEKGDVAPSEVLSAVKSIAQMDEKHGFVGLDDNDPIELSAKQVKGIGKDDVPDGDW